MSHGGHSTDLRQWGMSRIELVVFLVMLTVYSFFIQYPNVNQNTRFDLVRAIVEQHTVTIDDYQENTVDKSYFDGHWYADKAPRHVFPGSACLHAIAQAPAR